MEQISNARRNDEGLAGAPYRHIEGRPRRSPLVSTARPPKCGIDRRSVGISKRGDHTTVGEWRVWPDQTLFASQLYVSHVTHRPTDASTTKPAPRAMRTSRTDEAKSIGRSSANPVIVGTVLITIRGPDARRREVAAGGRALRWRSKGTRLARSQETSPRRWRTGPLRARGAKPGHSQTPPPSTARRMRVARGERCGR